MKKTKTKKLIKFNLYKLNLKYITAIALLLSVVSMKAEVVTNDFDLKIVNQDYTITGTITDDDGQPLPGANVIEKGTSNGTQSDFDGNFSITVSNSNAILEISYIGFKAQQVSVSNKSSIAVQMEVDASSLDEVVVVGYGTQRKSDITGAVASVSTKDIQELSVVRADEALQGRVSGVLIQNNDAAPNSTVSIRIRGANSLSGGNNPLVVIDGFQGADLNTLNPTEIASIEVLKDASATAIYGARGANGVILVTTKKGKSGKAKVSYNSFYSLRNVRKKFDLLNAGQYAELANVYRQELGQPLVFTQAEVNDFKANGGTDWQDAIFRNALEQSHQVSVSAGDENTSYYISGNVIDREGIVENSGYKRYSLRVNLTTKISEKFNLRSNLYIAREEDQPTQLNAFAGDNSGSPIFSALLFSPTKPIFDAEGNYTLPGGAGPSTNFNPVALAKEPIFDNIFNTTNFAATIEYKILDGLTFSVMGNYRSIDQEFNSFINNEPTASVGRETASIEDTRFLGLQNVNQFTYKKQITDNHYIDVTAAFEQQYEEFNSNFTGVRDLLTDAVTFNNLATGSENLGSRSERTERSLLSYIGRINYKYKDLYLFTATGRSDGSSVFGANNKRAFFPSVALGWNISNESFLENSNSVSNLKLRASYGISGNQAIAPYQSLQRLTSTTFSADGLNGAVAITAASQAANPDLKWESTAQFNVGVDLTMYNSRLRFTGDYYKKNTDDLLLNVPLPGTSGVGSVLTNVGEVQNKGIELSLGGVPVQTDKFTWDTNFNVAINDNEVLALAGEDEISLGEPGLPGFGNTIFLEVGKPIGQLRGYVQDGVWQSSEATEAAVFGAIPGSPKYVDQNNDGELTADDIVDIGNTLSDYTFGWNNKFSYGNFDLNIFIQGVQGNDIYNLGRIRTIHSADPTHVDILNRWTPQNQNTSIPSFAGNVNELQQSSRWIEDGSYIRFKTITLGYNFSDEVIDKLGWLSSARLYVTGTNLITITDYSGFDPESSDGVDTLGGIDLASYPSQKGFTLGLNINF